MKDLKALFFILHVVHETIFSRITRATTSKQAWTVLQSEFQGSTKVMVVKLQALRHQFETLLMKNNETVQDFLSRVTTITSQMEAYGEQITDETIVSKVLRSLPLKFDHVVAAIEESKDLLVFSFDELMGSLQSHEVNCWYKDENKEEERKLFMAIYNVDDVSNDVWFVDSGCSNHMTSVRSMFKDLDESYKIKVTLGDNKQVQVEGKGIVAVKVRSGKIKFIYNVNFVHGLAFNLLSVGQLMSSDFSVLFDDDLCVIKEKKLGKIVNVPMSGNNMFPLEVSDAGEYVLVADQRTESKLWHMWYGHLNIKGLKLFSSKGIGIRRELTAAYTPEQNGLAERKNRIVVEMARSLLKAKTLSNDFWAEAIATDVYLLNISPTKAVLNCTPHEAWRGTKPSVNHLEIFSCIAYVLVSSQNRKKFDEKSEKCVFIRYCSQSKAY
ncbi:hypothetical protein GQ457_06G009200 [Hibiscus cannabinus]